MSRCIDCDSVLNEDDWILDDGSRCNECYYSMLSCFSDEELQAIIERDLGDKNE